MFQSLSGKKVVIIGASSKIDLAVAKKAAELGASVVVSSSSQNEFNQAAFEKIEAINVDILNEDSVNAFFEQVGNFDHLVVTSLEEQKLLCSPIAEMATQTAQHVMEKFWGTFFAVRAAVKNIATNGSITLMPGISIFKTSKLGGISVISAANGAITVFGRTLAAELAPIRVNMIAPGVVEDTGVWSNQSDESKRSDLAKWAETALPVQRLGQPEEIAQAVLSLITNSYITGVVLPVDGGLTVL